MNQKIWRLAGPIMLANISVPLLGLVDTAVIGHLPGPEFLAAVAVGTTIFGVLYMGFNFLRMGTTGLVANASGAGDHQEVSNWLGHALLTAFFLGLLMCLLQVPIGRLAFMVIQPEGKAEALAHDYFFTRIWAAPAALTNFALLGWMIGVQRARTALGVQLVLNLSNILLDLLFVLGMKWGVVGAAAATVVAEVLTLVVGLTVAFPTLVRSWNRSSMNAWIAPAKMKRMFALNSDILLRSLCLQAVFVSFTAAGTRLGEEVLAANALLMNFQLFMAFGLDGFANAVEALTGEAMGARQRAQFLRTVKVGSIWALVFALGFSLVYALSWPQIIGTLTDVEIIRATAAKYVYWMVLLPMVSVWSFLLDGIFIGVTRTGAMRNSMFLSLLGFWACQYYLVPLFGNHGLWLTFTIFMALRAITLGAAWPGLLRRF